MKVFKDKNGHSEAIAYAVVTSDDKYLLTFGWDGKGIIWNTESGVLEHNLDKID